MHKINWFAELNSKGAVIKGWKVVDDSGVFNYIAIFDFQVFENLWNPLTEKANWSGIEVEICYHAACRLGKRHWIQREEPAPGGLGVGLRPQLSVLWFLLLGLLSSQPIHEDFSHLVVGERLRFSTKRILSKEKKWLLKGRARMRSTEVTLTTSFSLNPAYKMDLSEPISAWVKKRRYWRTWHTWLAWYCVTLVFFFSRYLRKPLTKSKPPGGFFCLWRYWIRKCKPLSGFLVDASKKYYSWFSISRPQSTFPFCPPKGEGGGWG